MIVEYAYTFASKPRNVALKTCKLWPFLYICCRKHIMKLNIVISIHLLYTYGKKIEALNNLKEIICLDGVAQSFGYYADPVLSKY